MIPVMWSQVNLNEAFALISVALSSICAHKHLWDKLQHGKLNANSMFNRILNADTEAEDNDFHCP